VARPSTAADPGNWFGYSGGVAISIADLRLFFASDELSSLRGLMPLRTPITQRCTLIWTLCSLLNASTASTGWRSREHLEVADRLAGASKQPAP
jgi:hypothetical protein